MSLKEKRKVLERAEQAVEDLEAEFLEARASVKMYAERLKVEYDLSSIKKAKSEMKSLKAKHDGLSKKLEKLITELEELLEDIDR